MKRAAPLFLLAILWGWPAGAAPAPHVARSVFAGLAIEPLASGSRDSDGNRTFGTGLTADIPLGRQVRQVRLGLRTLRTRVQDDLSTGITDDWRVRATMRPVRTWRLEASAGAARFAPPVGDVALRAVAGVRARWRAARGAALEARLERAPLLANPLLLDGHAMRSDGRLGGEVPVRAWRLRGTVRGARIESAGERNVRGQIDVAIARPLSPAVTPFVQYRSLGYAHPASSGYFAPHRVEMMESGSSFELGHGAPWLLSLDLGAGLQRIQAFAGAMGAWRPALRGYGYVSYAAGAGCELWLEAESESSPGLGTSASEDWRYRSLSLALRWARP